MTKFNPSAVIPYSEVTNEIGNLLLARCRVIVLAAFLLVSLMLKHVMSRSRIARASLPR